MIKKLIFGVIVMAVIGGVYACQAEDKTAGDIQKGTKDAAEKVSAVAGEVGEAAGKAVGAAKQTSLIKSALNNRRDIDSSDINVDTIERTIHLRGSVPNEADRKEAVSVAKAISGSDWTVKDELKVNSKGVAENEGRADDSGR